MTTQEAWRPSTSRPNNQAYDPAHPNNCCVARAKPLAAHGPQHQRAPDGCPSTPATANNTTAAVMQHKPLLRPMPRQSSYCCCKQYLAQPARGGANVPHMGAPTQSAAHRQQQRQAHKSSHQQCLCPGSQCAECSAVYKHGCARAASAHHPTPQAASTHCSSQVSWQHTPPTRTTASCPNAALKLPAHTAEPSCQHTLPTKPASRCHRAALKLSADMPPAC